MMEKIAIEKRLGISVKSWRTRLTIPQDELARRAGFHRSYISDIERGARPGILDNLGRQWRRDRNLLMHTKHCSQDRMLKTM